MKFRKNDTVIITTGGDRGKTGVISKILPKTGKLIIEGINKRIRHMKGRNGEPGQKIEFFAPIDASNVSIQDPKTGKPTKIGYKKEAGEKVRFARKSGTILPKNTEAVKAKKETPKKTTAKKK